MKSVVFSLFAFAAGVMANEAELIAQAIDQDRALRGNPNPLEMTPEEFERETRIVCRAVRNIIPRNCVCTGNFLSLTADFVCTAPAEECLPSYPIVGTVCATSQVTGTVKLALLSLSTQVTMKGCATNVTSDRQGDLGDVCASIKSTSGISGVSVDSCELSIGDQTCNTCIDCTTSAGRNGFGFDCEFLAAEFCVPIGLPFRAQGTMQGTSMSDFTSTQVWDDVAMGAALELAYSQA